MAEIRIAVSYLPKYKGLVTSVMPHVVAAFSPFGVNIHSEWGYPLNRDPVDENGWREVINFLTQKSAAAMPQTLAHVVLAEAPPGFDQSINGQLLNKARGVCAVFLGADSFHVQTPFNGLDLVAQVVIHEVGHLLNLTHSDANASGGYADAVMPSKLRLTQAATAAWAAAVLDAQSRGEPALAAPNPTLTYPFGVTCRSCLRAAATNPQWWPWKFPFRGDFDIASEVQDSSATMRIKNLARGKTVEVGHGIDFTLEIRNDAGQPLSVPLLIGPEYGNLLVSSSRPGTDSEDFFVPDNYRCSDSEEVIAPGAAIYRSFSLIPTKGQAFLSEEGKHELRVRLNVPDIGGARRLCSAIAIVEVSSSSVSRKTVDVASKLIDTVRGAARLPSEAAFSRLQELTLSSAITHYAKYKLAVLHTGEERARLLRDCMKAKVPTAVRHRAGRQFVLDEMRNGRMKSGPTKSIRRAFNRPEDAEFLESLNRMRDGWNALS